MAIIDIDNFHKAFGAVQAVNGVSLSIEEGALFGLIGPDGAGKTTLMRAICTLLTPDKGRILVDGLSTTEAVGGIRAILGYMPQRFSLYQDLSVAQNLRFFADLFQVPAAERSARMTQLYNFSRLAPFKKRKAGALSGGMKQKLALSCALIHTPRILLLDEPTFGVDPVSRKEFWDILRVIRGEGTTIFVSTAYMEEADQCDRVALFHRGEMAALDTPAGLRERYPYPLYRLRGKEVQRLRDFFQDIAAAHSIQLFGDALHVSFKQAPSAEDWQGWRTASEENLSDWAAQPPSIEDVFLNLITSGDWEKN